MYMNFNDMTFYLIAVVLTGLFLNALQNLLEPEHLYSDITFGDILSWSQELNISIAQLQKAYDWRIAQWSSAATAFLSATFAFISATVIETFKNPNILSSPDAVIIVMLGSFASIAIYGVCQYQIRRLRREFVRLYSLLNLIA